MKYAGAFSLACIALAVLARPALAACDSGLAERMHAKLHADRPLDHELALCQPWRGAPGRYVVALPLPIAGASSEQTDYDLDVLLVQQADNGNTERSVVLARSFEREAFTSDAMRVTGIRLDGARYHLAEGQQAFGLRFSRQASSRVSPYSEETLSLYLPKGPRLSKVLEEQRIVEERGEWDGDCTGHFETLRATVAIARASSNGLADLLLRQTRTQSESRMQADQCVASETSPRATTVHLRFDGLRYRGSAPDPGP